MVDNDCDILVSFPVAGLINTDVYKIVKAFGTLRLNDIQGSVNTPSYGLPVNAHVLGDGTAGQIQGKPSDSKVKVLGEVAVGVRPRNISDKDTMLRAFDAVCGIGHLNKGTAPVHSTSDAGLRILPVIRFTALKAERTVVFVPAVGARMNADMVHAMLIREKVTTFYDRGLDIEQFFA